MLEEFDPTKIQDEYARQGFIKLLNLVETLLQDNARLREENQQLRDEINRLKGEQGKPNIKPSKTASKISSEEERHQAKPHHKEAKLEKKEISRQEIVKIDPTILPKDAIFKGHQPSVVQDLIFTTENIRFLKEKYYSPSQKQTYLAALPAGYEGQFGPGVKALSLSLYYAGGMSQPKIQQFFEQAGLLVSAGELCDWLSKDHSVFHQESAAVFEAGVASSSWQHIDDTTTRVDGKNHYCHIVCNPCYTFYRTLPHKDRLSILQVLLGQHPVRFQLDEVALADLAELGLPLKWQLVLEAWPQHHHWEEAEVEKRLDSLKGLGNLGRKLIKDVMAVSAYQAQNDIRVVQTLVCDDAPQFHLISELLALCWVHEGRHYKKLNPVVAAHRVVLERVLEEFWEYYRELLVYHKKPSVEQAAQLSAKFEELFSQTTGYAALDKQLAATRSKKANLLLVLWQPEIPLHNNPAELGARQRVRKRDVSFGPRSQAGIKAWDTFQTLVATTQKLGINFYHYIQDRLRHTNQISKLADLIKQRAEVLGLDATPKTSPLY